MKKFVFLVLSIILILMSFALVSCNNEKENNQETIEENTIYTQEVIDEKYLFKKISDASAIYYKSSLDGEFGDENHLFETTILPNEYTEVEYIQSSGNNYIDTGIAYKDTLSFDLKFSDWTSDVNAGGVFGTNGWLFSIERRDVGLIKWYSEETSAFEYKSFSTTKEYTIQCSKDKFIINDQALKKQTNADNFATSNIYIFKSIMGYSICKIHYFKIYDGETVVRNYIPCFRNIDNKVGLFDLVSNTFFTDETNRFLYKSLNVSLNNLPKEYQQVEYVEATGNQRILTDFYLHGSDTITFSCEVTNSINTSTLWCARYGYQENTRSAFYIKDSGLRFDYYNCQRQTSVMELDTRLLIIQTPNNGIDTIINEQTELTHQAVNFTSSGTIQFFASYSKPQGETLIDNYSYLKFYYFKVEDINENVIAYFVPCYRKSDSAIGLFEMVSKKFYENLTTDPLICGNAINYDTNAYNIYNNFEEIEIEEYKSLILENQKLVRRLTDDSIGIIDYSNTTFEVLVDNSFNFNCGNIIGHHFDEGKVIAQSNEKQNGDTLYTCKICEKQIHQITPSSSYTVTFNCDSGVDYVKVYKGYDLSSFEKTNLAYSRNKNTNNFSRINAMVYVEFIFKNGFTIDKISTSGTMYSVKDNIYCFTNIKSNKTITISTKEND